MDVLLFFSGLAILAIAGEATLRGAVGLARQLDISPAVIGLTVVGIGTSLPELVVCIQAVLDDKPDLATGNIIGSNISNILLILGVGAVIYPLACDPRAVRRDGIAMALATVFCAVLALIGEIRPWIGLAMVVTLTTFLAWSYRHDQTTPDAASALHAREAEGLPDGSTGMGMSIVYVLLGLAGLTGGATLLVEGAVGLAKGYGVPESVIGLTMVAVGTSLPELFATVIAALRRRGDVAVGNVLGSNLFNILGTLGATAILGPLPFADDIRTIDTWVMVAATALAIPLMVTGWRISRREGILLIAAYGVYVVNLFFRGAGAA